MIRAWWRRYQARKKAKADQILREQEEAAKEEWHSLTEAQQAARFYKNAMERWHVLTSTNHPEAEIVWKNAEAHKRRYVRLRQKEMEEAVLEDKGDP